MASLFEVNEEGQIVYEENGNGAEGSASMEQSGVAAEPEANTQEILDDEVVLDGNVYIENPDSGNILPDEMESTEVIEEVTQAVVFPTDDNGAVPVTLSDEVTYALVNALTPASGSLGSSTLDYFDRIISGLPSDVVYIAYRTGDNNYDGVLYYSDDYDVENNIITFGEDTKEIRVVRSSYGGMNNIVQYYQNEADGARIAYDLDGDILYYTNAEIGYPILGGIVKPFDISPFIVVGLLSAMAVAILQKVFVRK